MFKQSLLQSSLEACQAFKTQSVMKIVQKNREPVKIKTL